MPVAVSANQSCTEPTGLPVQGYRKAKQNRRHRLCAGSAETISVVKFKCVCQTHSEANLKYSESLKQRKVHCRAKQKNSQFKNPELLNVL